MQRLATANRHAWLLLLAVGLPPAAADARSLVLTAPGHASVDGMTVRFTAVVGEPGRFVLLARQRASAFAVVGEVEAEAGQHDVAIEDAMPFGGFREYRLLYRDATGREAVLVSAEARPGLRSSSVPWLPSSSTQALVVPVGATPGCPRRLATGLAVTAVDPTLDLAAEIATPPPERAPRRS